MRIRRDLHARGFRFRLHVRGLPGRPDIVFLKYRAVIFVNGCFWHGHDCPLFKWPKTREVLWREKIGGTMEQDRTALVGLCAEGWRVAALWECRFDREGAAARQHAGRSFERMGEEQHWQL